MQARGIPAILLLVVFLVPLLAGCMPGGARSSGVPTADAPFTLTALDVGHGDARLADEAEAGFAPDQLRRRGRPRLSPGDGPSAVVRVRVDDLLQRRLADRAHLEGMSVSAVVREALRAHLR